MVKQIIKEAMDQNPLGLKEAVAEELRARVAEAISAKMEEVAESKEDLSQHSTESLKSYVKKVSGGGVPAFGHGAKLKRVQAELKRREKNVNEESANIEEAFKVGTKVKVDSPKDEDHGKAGKIVTAKNGTYVVQFVDGKRGSFNEDELVNESVDLEEAITAQNKKDAEAVVAYAKQNRGKGIATTAGDNRIIPNIQIVRYLESIGKVKNVKELPSGKGWSFELKESVDLEEADKWHAKWQLNPGIYMVGGDLSYDDKLEYTLKKADSDILNRFLTKASDSEKTKLWNMFWRSKERGNSVAQGPVNAINYAKKALNETAELEEAKMTDTEVLSAAKALAANGKDAKTRAFGKGLVDFYKKEGSFTPAQVGGLQNIMKNASFQMAKESVGLSEVDMGQARSVQDRRDSAKSSSGNKYHVVNKNGNVVSSHDNQGDAMRAAMKNDDYRVKRVS